MVSDQVNQLSIIHDFVECNGIESIPIAESEVLLEGSVYANRALLIESSPITRTFTTCLHSASYRIAKIFSHCVEQRNVAVRDMDQKFRAKLQASTGGSVVEFSPATREARVRFPASAVANKLFCKVFRQLFLAPEKC